MRDKNKNQSSDNPAFIVQFLALNLLILAFFILLVSMSSFEANKTKAVVDSMNSVFNPMAKVKIETVFSSKSGNIISAEEFQDHVEGVFSTAIGAVKTEIVDPGKVMRVVMPTARFFETNSATIREENLPLVDRIISSISARPPGYRFDMEFVIGGEPNALGCHLFHKRFKWPEQEHLLAACSLEESLETQFPLVCGTGIRNL